jgi:hypothetical protein
MTDKNLDILENEELESVASDEVVEIEEETTETTEEIISEKTAKKESDDMDSEDDEEEVTESEESDDDDDDDDDDEEEVEETKSKKESWKKGKKVTKEDIDVAEHMDAMLSGQELTEDFRDKAKTIFEAAVLEKINEEVDRLDAQYEETLEENVAEIRTEVSEKVDEYLTYVAKEWLEENKLAVENGLKLEIMENFIKGLKSVFVENYIDIPEEKIDLYQESQTKLEDTESKLNEQIEKNVKLVKEINETRRVIALRDLTEGLTDTQKDKIASLAEGVEYTSDEEYREKVAIIKENYFPKSGVVTESTDTETSTESVITEETDTALEDSPAVIKEESEKQVRSSAMDIYTETLTRFSKK